MFSTKRPDAYDVENAHVLLLEVIPVLQGSHANSVALHLAGVGWANSTLGGTDLEISTVQLVDSIADLMEVEHDMSSVRDEQSTKLMHILHTLPVLNVDLDLLQGLNLLEESEDIDNASIANDALRLGLHNTDGNEVESHSLAIVDNGVTSVGTSSSTAAEIISEHHPRILNCLPVTDRIDELSLSLVSPLASQNNIQLRHIAIQVLINQECLIHSKVSPSSPAGISTNYRTGNCKKIYNKQIKSQRSFHSL